MVPKFDPRECAKRCKCGRLVNPWASSYEEGVCLTCTISKYTSRRSHNAREYAEQHALHTPTKEDG